MSWRSCGWLRTRSWDGKGRIGRLGWSRGAAAGSTPPGCVHSTSIHAFVMNSPIEPDSPASSASSDTQPGEETANIPSISIGPTVGSQTHAIFARATASTKRRLPSGAGHSTSARDSKSRRKENLGGSKKHPLVSDWVEGKASESRQKEDFIDGQLSEALKKIIQDPFDDEFIIAAS